jgi:hypothetical protein
MFKLKTYRILGFYLLALVQFNLSGQELVINEFLASNASVNADPDFNDYSDWIELFNRGADTINLGGFYITDNFSDTAKWSFPDELLLLPGEFLLIWADGKDTALSAYHSSFKLSSGGEEIALFDTSGTLLDSIEFPDQKQDFSFGRQPDGGADW